jgi:hypothetical protein
MPKLVIFFIFFDSFLVTQQLMTKLICQFRSKKKESWTSSWVIFSAVEFGNKIEVSLSYDHKSVINRYTLEIQRFTRVDQ